MRVKMFHVYALLDPNIPGDFNYGKYHFDFEPFYIGKGKNNRLYDHVYKAKNTNISSYRLNRIRKILLTGAVPISVKIQFDLSESDAFYLEKEMISLLGRKDMNCGPLTNLSDGGEGDAGWASNRKGKTYEEIYGEDRSRSVREKITNSQKGKIISEEQKIQISKTLTGRSLSENTKRKLSERNKGRNVTWGEKISLANKGRKLTAEALFNSREASKKRRGSKLSKQTCDKMSKARIGRIVTQETREKISQSQKGKKISEQQKEVLRQQRRGKSYEEYFGKETAKEMKKKQSESRMKHYKITDPNGKTFVTKGLKQFCDEHSLNIRCLRRVMSGERNHHHNWGCELLKPVDN